VARNEQFMLATIEMALHLHKTESLLEENKQFLHDVFNSIQDGIIVLDKELTIIRVNEIMRDWYTGGGHPEGKKCFEVFKNQSSPCEHCPALSSFLSGRTTIGPEVALSGLSVSWVEVFCYPMKDSRTGTITGVVEHLRDISKRRETEKQLNQSYLRSRWLNAIAKHVLTGWDMREIIEYTVNLISGHFPDYRVSYSIIDTEGRFKILFSAGPSRIQNLTGKEISIADPEQYFDLLQEKQPIVISTKQENNRLKPFRDLLAGADTRSVIIAPLVHSEEELGILSFESTVQQAWSTHETATLRELANYLALALKNETVQEKLKESEKQYRELSGHLQKAREEQNAHIAREIHDDLGQSLTALKMNISILEKDIGKQGGQVDHDSVHQTVSDMKEILDSTVTKVRELSKELRPSVLDTSNIIEALEWQTQEFTNYSGIPVRFRNETEGFELNKDQSLAVFRIVQEALTNIARHSRADWGEVIVEEENSSVMIKIHDNGVGFSIDEQEIQSSFGIINMRERASFCGGVLSIGSNEGAGTTVALRIPFERSV
jgi:signal transduction histidine kinase